MKDGRIPARNPGRVLQAGTIADFLRRVREKPDVVSYCELEPFTTELFDAYLRTLVGAKVMSGIRRVNINRSNFLGTLMLEMSRFTNLGRLELAKNQIEGAMDLSGCLRLRRLALFRTTFVNMPNKHPWIVLPPQAQKLRLVGDSFPETEVNRLQGLHPTLQIRRSQDSNEE